MLPFYSSHGIVKCPACALVFYDDTASPEELYTERYFTGGEYRDYVADKSTIQRNFRRRLPEMLRLAPRGSLLEIGSAYGFFLELARRHWTVRGIEIAPEAARHARDQLGLDVQCAEFLELPDEPEGYDLICMWDTVEHLTQSGADCGEAQPLAAAGRSLDRDDRRHRELDGAGAEIPLAAHSPAHAPLLLLPPDARARGHAGRSPGPAPLARRILARTAGHASRRTAGEHCPPPTPRPAPGARQRVERPRVSQPLRHHDDGRSEAGRGRWRVAHGRSMIWTGKKVLVTGAGGFIGSHLLRGARRRRAPW